MVGTGVVVAISIFLHEDSSRCREGCVSHDKELFGGIGHSNYWSREEDFFKLDESVVLFFHPGEGHSFLS